MYLIKNGSLLETSYSILSQLIIKVYSIHPIIKGHSDLLTRFQPKIYQHKMQSTDQDDQHLKVEQQVDEERKQIRKRQLSHSGAVGSARSVELASEMDDGSAANSVGGRIAVQDIDAEQASATKDGEKVPGVPLLDEDDDHDHVAEGSGPPSELYETDSSNDQGSFIHANDNNSSSSSEKLLGTGMQGEDIVAGSPSKLPCVADLMCG